MAKHPKATPAPTPRPEPSRTRRDELIRNLTTNKQLSSDRIRQILADRKEMGFVIRFFSLPSLFISPVNSSTDADDRYWTTRLGSILNWKELLAVTGAPPHGRWRRHVPAVPPVPEEQLGRGAGSRLDLEGARRANLSFRSMAGRRV